MRKAPAWFWPAAVILLLIALLWGLRLKQFRDAQDGRLLPPTSTSQMHKGDVNSLIQPHPSPTAGPQNPATGLPTPMEAVIRFADLPALQRFIAENPSLQIIDRIDSLLALRLRANDPAAMAKLSELIDSGLVEPNHHFHLPLLPPPPSSLSPDQAFGLGVLDALGVPADNDHWGQGIRVAVLDAGLHPHPALANSSVSIVDLTDGAPGGPATAHGNAVTSLIAASHPMTNGIAPSAEVTMFRVLDENGMGDSFTIARAILEAAHSGHQIINLSLGGPSDSSVLRDAVAIAQQMGVLIVAASGNEALAKPSYPAAYPGVLTVGASDTNNAAAAFSNYGKSLDLLAPGVGVAAAWQDDRWVAFSGTSAAAPLVTGTAAAIMSLNPGTTGQEAAAVILKNTDDAGAAGPDPLHGAGILNVHRILQSTTPGIYDAAVVSQQIQPSSNGPLLTVAVQNRGTEPLAQIHLRIHTAAQQFAHVFQHLQPGQSAAYAVPVPLSVPQQATSWNITSEVLIPGHQDANPSNNQLQTVWMR